MNSFTSLIQEKQNTAFYICMLLGFLLFVLILLSPIIFLPHRAVVSSLLFFHVGFLLHHQYLDHHLIRADWSGKKNYNRVCHHFLPRSGNQQSLYSQSSNRDSISPQFGRSSGSAQQSASTNQFATILL